MFSVNGHFPNVSREGVVLFAATDRRHHFQLVVKERRLYPVKSLDFLGKVRQTVDSYLPLVGQNVSFKWLWLSWQKRAYLQGYLGLFEREHETAPITLRDSIDAFDAQYPTRFLQLHNQRA